MKIIFFRHAKTELNSKSGKDFDRALRPNGLKQCKEMQAFLKKEFNEVEFFALCSTAKRARQTYKAAFANRMAKVNFLDELYLASADELIQIIQNEDLPSDAQLVVIGHNDGLTNLVNYLTDETLYIQTSGWVEVIVEYDDLKLLSRGTGTIARYYRPNLAV